MSIRGSRYAPGTKKMVDLLSSDHFLRRFAETCPDFGASHSVYDATFYLRQDGILVCAEGWFHPPGALVGEVLYVPDPSGNKVFFGQSYRKVTLHAGTDNPVAYSERPAALALFDPALDQRAVNPFFATHKQILPLTDFLVVFGGMRAFQAVSALPAVQVEEVFRDIESLERLLGFRVTEMRLGLTGSLALGQLSGYHDFDIVFYGSVGTNRELAERMRWLTSRDPSRRCHENRKDWQIRFFDNRQKLMCCHFGYLNSDDAPLKQFAANPLAESITIEGVVSDDQHTVYTPTVLWLREAHSIGQTDTQIDENILLVIYHTASRGDCYVGDSVRASGTLTTLELRGVCHQALFATQREAVRNLSPPWPGYYRD